MFHPLGTVTLKSGERVGASVVRCPDVAHAPELEQLLQHKGDIWQWQNSELLRAETGIEARFHVLHRGDAIFANILTGELHGVGLFGHVWTQPQDRGQGAASLLQDLLLEDFRARGGKALYLGTSFGSQAYRIYQKAGFIDLAPGSGQMRYVVGDVAEFDRRHVDVRDGDVAVAPLGWAHWPTSSVLFAGDQAGAIRAPSLGLIGRTLTEGAFLPLIRAERSRAAGEAPHAVGLQATNGAFLGFACRTPHAVWAGVDQLDLYCHPAWWRRAGDLVAALRLSADQRLVAYVDPQAPEQGRAYAAAGFRRAATLPRLRREAGGFAPVDVYERG